MCIYVWDCCLTLSRCMCIYVWDCCFTVKWAVFFLYHGGHIQFGEMMSSLCCAISRSAENTNYSRAGLEPLISLEVCNLTITPTMRCMCCKSNNLLLQLRNSAQHTEHYFPAMHCFKHCEWFFCLFGGV